MKRGGALSRETVVRPLAAGTPHKLVDGGEVIDRVECIQHYHSTRQLLFVFSAPYCQLWSAASISGQQLGWIWDGSKAHLCVVVCLRGPRKVLF